jgi:hypothetical protein
VGATSKGFEVDFVGHIGKKALPHEVFHAWNNQGIPYPIFFVTRIDLSLGLEAQI